MSFVINSVNLHNFRAHKNIQFNPNPHGITVIKGENGAGKSSLVDSIAWCLYGTKPKGVSKNSDLRKEGTNPKQDITYARVTITTNTNETYITERRIHGTKGVTECDVYKLTTTEKNDANTHNTIAHNMTTMGTLAEGEHTTRINNTTHNTTLEHMAGPSVTHATNYLRTILGIHEKGFLTSMFVQQKQVDELLTASPKDRSAVIEKMMNITALTEAVGNLRTEVRDTKKEMGVYNNIAGNINISDIEQQLNNTQKTIDETTTLINNTKMEGKTLKNSIAETETIVNNHNAITNKITDTENTIAELQEKLTTVKKQGCETKQELEQQQKTLESIINNIGGDPHTAEMKTEAMRKQHKELKQYQTATENNLRNLKNTLGLHTTTITSTLGDVDTTNPEQCSIKLSEKINETTKQVNNTEATKNTLFTELTELKQTITLNNQTIDALSGDGVCPTCHQKPQHVENLLEKLQETNTTLKTQYSNKKTMYNNTKNLLGELNNTMSTLSTIGSTINQLAETTSSINTTTSEYDTITQKLVEVENKIAKRANIEKMLTMWREQQTIVTELANTQLQQKTLIKNYMEQKTEQTQNLEELQGQQQKTQKQLDGAPITPTNLHTEKQRLEELRNTLSNHKVTLATLESEKKHIQQEKTKAEKTIAMKQKYAEKYERVASAHTIVSTFRTNRINNIIPEISTVASELLSEFTDGAFVNMELDANYKATVTTNTGEQRDIGILSGGELSAVALSLRLAVALISHGHSDNTTMILDEVLVSQDEHRVENIIQTIKEKLHGQVILIGHNGDIVSSIADTIMEITNSGAHHTTNTKN